LQLIPNIDDLIVALYFIVPAYTTNSTSLLLGGGKPIDFEARFIDGERIFGAHKTINGFLGGLAFGTMTALVEELTFERGLGLTGFLVALGSVLGDLAGAFVKRRMKISPGNPLPVIDQLDFVAGALLLSYPFANYPLGMIVFVVLVTPPFHILTNAIAYVLKIKGAFW